MDARGAELFTQTTLKDSITQAKRVEPTMIPSSSRAGIAARLHLMNFFSRNPEATNPDERETQAVQDIRRREEHARNGNRIVPPEGVEIETLDVYQKQGFAETSELVLKQAGLVVVPEGNRGITSETILEIRPPWSYSADAQIITIQELVRMKALPMVAGPGRAELDTGIFPLSFHVNFAIPFGIENIENFKHAYEKDIHAVIDALALAYVSPERMENRKVGGSYNFHTDVDPTDKYLDNTKGDKYRLELRPFEVSDMYVQDLLHSSQRLVAGLFARIALNNPKIFRELSLKEQDEVKDAAHAFLEFKREFDAFRITSGGIKGNFAESSTATELVKQLGPTTGARELVTKHGKVLGDIFGLTESEGPTQPPR